MFEFRRPLRRWNFFATALLLAVPARAADVKTLLKEADAFRLSGESVRVDTEVRVLKSGTLDKTRLYAVYVKPGRRSLVVFRSPSERGQKMLMLGDDFWLVLPTSQRPRGRRSRDRRRALPEARHRRAAQGRLLSAHRPLSRQERPPSRSRGALRRLRQARKAGGFQVRRR